MKPESKNLDDYLVVDTIVDWKTPDVQQAALNLTRSIPDEVDKAQCLYEWVRDAIPHTNDAGLEIVTCREVNAQFSVDKEQLAFPMEAAAGEFIYDTIFAAPVSNVVNKLKKYESRRELWLDLPKAFENTT